jgi:hypothetical protein
MTPSPHIAETEHTTVGQRTSVHEILAEMEEPDIETLAALADAPTGVAELAFNAFPEGTRAWAITYGLATEESDGTLAITDLGRKAVELAAERCPQPYRDISLEDVMASTQQAIDELVERSGVQIREPGTHPDQEETAASAMRRSGRQVAERLLERLQS